MSTEDFRTPKTSGSQYNNPLPRVKRNGVSFLHEATFIRQVSIPERVIRAGIYENQKGGQGAIWERRRDRWVEENPGLASGFRR
jgi:hypothetical protein